LAADGGGMELKMKIKTYIATYVLILLILFSGVGMVSFYLNNSQINMLREKSAGQFQTIVSSLDKDIAVLWGRHEWLVADTGFNEAVNALVRRYARYYDRHNINLSVTNLHYNHNNTTPHSEITVVNTDKGYFIAISGLLMEPFGYFLLDYSLNITENIANMRNIQATLLIMAIAFSIIAAVALYLILSSIFKPFSIVAKVSRKIANGQFSQRIPVNTKNEVAQVAHDFNKMAEKIEKQIILLEEESVNKQQFIDNFAHEMRTPLTSIYGYAEYMQKALLDDGEVIDLSGRIMNKSSYLNEIANSLLQLALLRDYVPDKQEILITHLFEDIHLTVKTLVENKNINFTYKSYIKTMVGQEDLIKSLLLNLCINAIKACTPNDSSIYMEAKKDESCIVLSVTDNGCGIPTDALAKVTQPFYRVDTARDQKHGGSGLGLTLCQNIVEAHKAKMVIESIIDVGTTITITFTNP